MAKASRWLKVFEEFTKDLRIRSKNVSSQDDRGVPFKMWESQKRFLRFLAEGLDDDIRIFYFLKSRQLGVCLDPETKVLTADLRWTKMKDFKIGDEVVAVDEYPLRKGKGQHRKMRTARVQGVVYVRRHAYRITFDDGRSVICTAQHPWFSKRGEHPQSERLWCSLGAKDKRSRIGVGSFVRWITHPWGDPTVEDGWFGGILDGEGSISNESRSGTAICAAQRPGAVWDRMVKYAADRGYSWYVEADDTERRTKFGKVPVPKLMFTRMNEIFRLLGQTRPSRFVNSRFWEGRELPGKHSGEGWSRIVAVDFLGERDLIDFQTSTGTYIAEGFVSHNTTLSLAIDLFWLATHRHLDAALVTENEQNRDKNREMLKHYLNSFPPGYFGDDFYIVKGKDNVKSMTFSNGSRLTFLVAGTKKKAISWGEGAGFAMAHLTECASYSGSEGLTSFEESFTQTNPDRLYIYESTAKGMNNVWYDRWKLAESDPLTRRGHFLGWWTSAENIVQRDDPRFAKYGKTPRTREERELIEQVAKLYDYEVTPEQLCWFRWRSDTITGEEAAVFAQNQPWTATQAFVVTGYSFFQVRLLSKHGREIEDNPEVHSYQGYRYFYGESFFDMKLEFLDPNEEDLLEQIELRVWEEPRDDGRYVIGMDPAFGDDHGDNICISVWRCYADCIEQVAEFATNRIEPKRSAWVLAHLAGVYKDCIINLELGGGGTNVMQELDSLRGQLKSDMYADHVRSRDWEDAMGWARWYLYHRPDSMGKGYLLNFKANYDTKRSMLYGYNGAFVTNELMIHSVRLILEMQNVRVEGTTIGAPESTSEDCKDDRVIAAGLACKAWNDWRKAEMIALGLTRKRVMEESAGLAPQVTQRVNNLVYRFMQTLDQQAAEAHLAPIETWRSERGL